MFYLAIFRRDVWSFEGGICVTEGVVRKAWGTLLFLGWDWGAAGKRLRV